MGTGFAPNPAPQRLEMENFGFITKIFRNYTSESEKNFTFGTNVLPEDQIISKIRIGE